VAIATAIPSEMHCTNKSTYVGLRIYHWRKHPFSDEDTKRGAQSPPAGQNSSSSSATIIRFGVENTIVYYDNDD